MGGYRAVPSTLQVIYPYAPRRKSTDVACVRWRTYVYHAPMHASVQKIAVPVAGGRLVSSVADAYGHRATATVLTDLAEDGATGQVGGQEGASSDAVIVRR